MPARSHRSDIIILVTLGTITVLVVVALVSWGWLRQGERGFPMRTTHSAGREGTMACYMLFDRLGVEVRRLERPLLDEALEGVDVLFVVDPVLGLEQGEVSSLRAWVRGGGVLVWSADEFFEFGGGQRVYIPRRSDGVVVPTRVPPDEAELPLARDVATVLFDTLNDVTERGQGPFDTDSEDEALFADTVGVRIVSRRMGDGHVIVLADASFLANVRFGKEDNCVLGANLVEYVLAQARGARVAFDEYHFGFGKRETGWSLLGTALMRTSPGWAVLCLTGAGVLFLVYKGRRFGTRYAPTRVRRRTKLEYVHSVGATYQAAGAHGLALRMIYQWFRREAAWSVGLPPSASVETLAAQLARRTLHGPDRYEKILRQCEEALLEPRLGARRTAALVEQLALIESEVLNGHRARK